MPHIFTLNWLSNLFCSKKYCFWAPCHKHLPWNLHLFHWSLSPMLFWVLKLLLDQAVNTVYLVAYGCMDYRIDIVACIRWYIVSWPEIEHNSLGGSLEKQLTPPYNPQQNVVDHSGNGTMYAQSRTAHLHFEHSLTGPFTFYFLDMHLFNLCIIYFHYLYTQFLH